MTGERHTSPADARSSHWKKNMEVSRRCWRPGLLLSCRSRLLAPGLSPLSAQSYILKRREASARVITGHTAGLRVTNSQVSRLSLFALSNVTESNRMRPSLACLRTEHEPFNFTGRGARQ